MLNLIQKNFFKIKQITLSSKEVTYGAIFAAASAALIIMLITFTPIAALPTVRIAFEGILVKLSGYLFGIIVGFIAGNITEILISIMRPTFIHWTYYFTIVLYGVFGGIIRKLKNKQKNEFKAQIALLSFSSIVFTLLATILIIHHDGFIIDFRGSSTITIPLSLSLLFLYISQAVILMILPIIYFVLTFLLPRFFYLFHEIAPIYFLSILTGYFITIPLTTLGDSVSYQQPYQLLILIAIAQVPLNVIVNMFVIYFVWRILNSIITNSRKGTYQKNVSSMWKVKYFQNKIQSITTKNLSFAKILNYPIAKKIRLFRKYEYFPVIGFDSKIISVTGTNGKSSTCFYISKYLTSKNIRNGLFISPHLFNINERIQINGIPISNESLEKLYYRIFPYSRILGLSYYEYLFFMASVYFRNKGLKYIIVEGGIGAKNDVCGALRNDASIITNIAKDHKRYLGSSLVDIAKDKVHIAKPYKYFFVNERNKQILNVYNSWIIGKYIKFKNFAKNISIKNNHFKINEQNFNNDWMSTQELKNISLATLFIKSYIDKETSTEEIAKYLQKIKIPGRNEYVKYNNLNIYLDCCHNIDGITEYCNYITQKHNISAIFCSLSSDKDIESIFKYLNTLKRKNIEIFYFQNSNKRSINKATTFFKNKNILIYSYKDFEIICKKNKFTDISIIGSFYFYYNIMTIIKETQ